MMTHYSSEIENNNRLVILSVVNLIGSSLCPGFGAQWDVQSIISVDIVK